MMIGWRILQMIVMTAVVFSNIYWEWTPNPYLASIIGAVVAWLVSIGVASLIDLSRKLRWHWESKRHL